MARQTVERHPQYNQAYEVLYAIYGSQQNWDKAEALLKLWVANNPTESNPVLRLAAFYYARKAAGRCREDTEFPAGPARAVSAGGFAGGRFSCPDPPTGKGAGGLSNGVNPGITSASRFIRSASPACWPRWDGATEAIKAADDDPGEGSQEPVRARAESRSAGADGRRAKSEYRGHPGNRSGHGSPGQCETATAGRTGVLVEWQAR